MQSSLETAVRRLHALSQSRERNLAMNQSRHPLVAAFVVMLSLALLMPALRAANGIWTNPAGGDWNLASNWSGGIPQNVGDMADFSTIDLPAATAINLNLAATVGNMRFNDTGPDLDSGYTISGANTLTFNDNDTEAVVDVTRGHHEIATAIQITDTVRFNITNDTFTSLHLSGKISGSGALRNSNNPSGRLILSNSANDFTGGMTAFNGQGGVEARASNVFGSGAMTATPSVGGTWYFTTANQTHANTLNIYNTGTSVNVATGITVDWTGNIQGGTLNPDKLMFRGTGTLKLSGDNSGLDGGIQVNDSGATVILAHANALGSGSLYGYHQTNPVNVGAAGGNRTYSGGLTSAIFTPVEWHFVNVDGSNLTFNGTVTQNNQASDFNVDLGITATLNGDFTGNTNANNWLDKTGAGTLVLGGSNNTTTGGAAPMGWRLYNGTLGIGNNHALQSDSGKAFEVVNNVNPKTITAVGGTRTIANPIIFNGSVIVDGSNDLELSGATSGVGGITKNGSGTLTYSGTVGHGSTTVNAGRLVIAAGTTAANVIMNAGIIGGDGTLTSSLNAITGVTVAPGISSPGTLTLDGANYSQNGGMLEIEFESDFVFDVLALINGGDATLTSGTLWLAVLGDYQPTFGATFDVLTADTITGMLTLGGPHAAWFGGPQIVNLDGGGQALRLTSIIPEPTAGMLLACGGLLALRRRQRRA